MSDICHISLHPYLSEDWPLQMTVENGGGLCEAH